MRMNQCETTEKQNAKCGKLLSRDATRRRAPACCSPKDELTVATRQSGFTLTELLVVITIIAILAGLITGAAMRALNKAKQVAISVEIQQLTTAMEDFKNQYGSYPPNIFDNDDTTLNLTNNDVDQNTKNVNLYMKRVAARSTESANVDNLLVTGLSPAEAIVFWLSGFSADVQRPLSGTDLVATSIDDDGSIVNNVITIDSFQAPLYDFDRSRLKISRDGDNNRRFLEIFQADGTGPFQIQLYEYLAEGSDEPFVYFDTSRDSPLQAVRNWDKTEFFYASRNPSGGNIYPLKQLRPSAPEVNELQNIEYVQKGKFQILHCGIDNLWGDFSTAGVGAELNVSPSNPNSTDPSNVNLLFPTGPFLDDVADTLTNFSTENLADSQEE